MKAINISLEDDEFEELSRLKIKFGFNSWRELIISLVNIRERTIEVAEKYGGIKNGY